MVLVALLDPIRPYFDLISPVTRPTQGDLKPAFEVATLALNALRMLSHLVLVAALPNAYEWGRHAMVYAAHSDSSLRQIQYFATHHDAGVVEHEIQPASSTYYGFYASTQLCFITHVEFIHFAFTTPCFERVKRKLGCFGVHICDNDVRTTARQGHTKPFTQSRTTTRYDGYPAFEHVSH